MTDKTTEVWEVTHNNSIVRVENWWTIIGGKRSEISLYVDDKLLDSSDENIVDPNKPNSCMSRKRLEIKID